MRSSLSILWRHSGSFRREFCIRSYLTSFWRDNEFTDMKSKMYLMLYQWVTFDKNFLMQKCKCQSRSFGIFHLINSGTLKNVNRVLSILAVFPITTATPERLFLTLKKIKNYLRNTMGQDRLSGFAYLNIHTRIKFTEILPAFFNKNLILIHIWTFL